MKGNFSIVTWFAPFLEAIEGFYQKDGIFKNTKLLRAGGVFLALDTVSI